MAEQAKNYVIGCKLPHGIKFKLGEKWFVFNGLNSTNIIGGFGITDNVSADVWSAFKKLHPTFVDKGAIFQVTDRNSAEAAAKDKAKAKTGFEQADPKSVGVEKHKEE